MSDASRHIGLDLGGTNIKWAVVQRAGDDWETLDQGTEPTDLAGGERSVVPQLAALALQLRDAGDVPPWEWRSQASTSPRRAS
jgi:predicted NBD/HSP70 family sugar kinase